MDLSPTDAKLVSIDLYKTDEKYNFKLTDILRKRQRPMLLVIDETGELIYSSLPDDNSDNRLNARTITPRLMEQALVEAKRLFRAEQIPVATVIRQVVVFYLLITFVRSCGVTCITVRGVTRTNVMSK